jgi:multidrug efflux pump
LISHFFIDRPIFAAVLSIVITLTGGLALLVLPIAQYPEITPPSVQVSISYPGASAAVVADTVAAPIEQQVNGVAGMLYMSSQSGNDGSYTLTVTFDIGTDLNTALVMVQNRVALAMPQLPGAVGRQGITIRKKTPDILQVVNFYSPDGRYDALYLSNFLTINVKDELLRLEGVSDINIFGQRDYSIRAWLNPQKLAACGINAAEVVNAIRTQNLEAAPGQIGQPPTPPGQSEQLPLDTLGRLARPEQFGDIVIRVGQGGPSPPSPALAFALQPGGAVPGGGAFSPGTTGGGTPGGLALIGASGGGTTSGGATSAGGGTTGGGASSTGPAGVSTTGGANSTSTTSTIGPSSTGVLGISSTSSSTSSTSSTAGGTTGTAGTTGGAAAGDTMTAATLGGPPPGTAPSGAAAAATTSGGPQGVSASLVRLRDVARVEMGAQNYNMDCTFDGYPSVGLAIHQLPGTNALDVAERVQARLAELRSRFPDGIAYDVAYDITPFVRESVMDVVRTLFEAVALVAVVVLLFLQNWRAALIPLIAVPVAIIGTFAVMLALGFSLNNISLFGLVLAIGIVVDDAIVVVENVERWLEQRLPPREAARRAMNEVTGPVIAVALVLCAVFVPCAFISGITGRFFRQFAVTIAASTVISAVNSLTLSPALAAILLRPHGARRDPLTWLLDMTLGWLFRGFNWVFRVGTAGYTHAVGGLLRVSVVVLLVYGGLLVLTFWTLQSAPMGFVPQQDQGRLIAAVQLPDSASLQRTNATIAQAVKICQETPGVAHTITISGLSFLLSANSSNFGSMFIVLEPFEKRRSPELHANAIMARLQRAFNRQLRDGVVSVFGAPPIPGLGVASGFKLMVEDRSGLGLSFLQDQTEKLIAELRHEPGLVGVGTQFRSNTPQLWMDPDRTKAASLGVSFDDLNQTMQVYLGSVYVNSFNEFGRYWQMTVQAEGKFRTRVPDVNLLQVRNQRGQMVPLATLVHMREVSGPVMVQRYNLYAAAPVTGNIRPGFSTGEGIAAIDAAAFQTLPRSMSTEWTELMFMQIRAGNTAMYVFALAVVFVFLALAALYESWSLPLAVILVVPLCLLCSLGGVLFASLSVDIFVQIGLVVLVGLACKNAILIVEFAQVLRVQGRPRYEATVEASRLRLRPILMTSLAFILGVLPLVIATGAGAEMRRSLGTAVFSGMLGVTLFGIFLTPVFFYVIQWFGETRVFATWTTRWVGSGMLGGLLGLATGFLLGELGVVRQLWAMALGLCVGAGAALLVPEVWRRIKAGVR